MTDRARYLFPATAGLVVIMVISGCPEYRVSTPPTQGAEPQHAEAEGPKTAKRPGDLHPPMGPLRAPRFRLRTHSGRVISNETLADGPLVLNFFAHDCQHSQKQLPRVELVRTQYGPKGVAFLNVCGSMRQTYTEDEVASRLAALGVTGDFAIDVENRARLRFKALSFPTVYVIERGGRIARVIVGNNETLEQQLKAAIDAVLVGGKDGP